MITDQIRRFIDDRHINNYATFTSSSIEKSFMLSYYNAYTLFALTNKNIIFLNEKILLSVKDHKKKLFFVFVFNKKYETIELTKLVFASPLQKCIRVVTAIKNILSEFNIGTHITNITGKDKKTYTLIEILKML